MPKRKPARIQIEILANFAGELQHKVCTKILCEMLTAWATGCLWQNKKNKIEINIDEKSVNLPRSMDRIEIKCGFEGHKFHTPVVQQ